MAKIGPEGEWTTVHSGPFVRLENVQVDPTTGVAITWHKNPGPNNFTESREEKLPNSSLYRFIYYEVKPDGEIEEKSYTIGSNENGLRKSIQFTPLSEPPRSDLMMLAKEEGSSVGFNASYKGDKLVEIEIDHSSFKLPAVLESLYQRQLSVNLKELAQIYKELGLNKTFYPGLLMSIDRKNQEQYFDAEKSKQREKIDGIMEGWPEREKELFIMEVRSIVGGFVSACLKDEFQKSDMDDLSTALTVTVLEELPSDYNLIKSEEFLSRERRLLTGRILFRNVVILLSKHQTLHDNLFDLETSFTFIDDEVIEVEMRDGSTYESTHQGQMRFGETYRYDNYNYSMERAQDGKVTAAVSHIARPDHRSQIRVPQTIDLQEFTRLVTTPDSIGWEKALDVADIEYKRT